MLVLMSLCVNSEKLLCMRCVMFWLFWFVLMSLVVRCVILCRLLCVIYVFSSVLVCRMCMCICLIWNMMLIDMLLWYRCVNMLLMVIWYLLSSMCR